TCAIGYMAWEVCQGRLGRARRALSPARSTAPDAASRLASSSLASCATTSHRPAADAAARATARASSTLAGASGLGHDWATGVSTRSISVDLGSRTALFSRSSALDGCSPRFAKPSYEGSNPFRTSKIQPLHWPRLLDRHSP